MAYFLPERGLRWGQRGLLAAGLLALGSATTVAPLGTGTGGMVAAGAYISAFAPGDGRLYVWGLNSSCQLGFPRTRAQLRPTRKPLPPGAEVTQVVGGGNFLVALTRAGAVLGWGDNYVGQLGTGTSNAPDERTRTARLPPGVRLLQLAAGDAFTAALATSGVIYCWGDNVNGQGGISIQRNPRLPHPIDMPAGVRFGQVAASRYHCLGLSTDGQVYAWGQNTHGVLGLGRNDDDAPPHFVPTLVPLPAGVRVVQVATGAYHSLALTATGDLYTWGDNEYGELGDGTTTTRFAPHRVALPPGLRFTQVYAGSGAWFSLALTAEGTVYTWGAHSSGQPDLGTGAPQLRPRLVRLPAGVRCVQLASDFGHTLALTDAGTLYAWGRNEYGQLGTTGTKQEYPSPVPATALRL